MKEDYFREHLSLSEWLMRADVPDRDRLIREDATKRRRLAFLSERIKLPTVYTTSFRIEEILESSGRFTAFVASVGRNLYAVRATPPANGQPVLRNRDLTVPDLVAWIRSLGVDLREYDLSFEPHIDPTISAVFVVGDLRIFGEAAHGSILQLNKGMVPQQAHFRFEFDYHTWSFSDSDPELERFIRTAVQFVDIKDQDAKDAVKTSMNARFKDNYLCGYFEVLEAPAIGPIFIDYNRELARNAVDVGLSPRIERAGHKEITGQSACRGLVKGPARVVLSEEVDGVQLDLGSVLVCHFTSPAFVPLIVCASAVVTDIGGVLSHAAIVCRELGKTCVVGTKTATEAITDGQQIEVDGDHGVVRLL